MDINADAGESFGRWTLGDDAGLFAQLTSVNLALGFHAGDPPGLAAAVKLALRHGLGIGAHPGYPDLQGFGRRELALTAGEIYAATLYQLGALSGFLRAEKTEMQHVKAHGALYLRIHADQAAGEAFCQAVQVFAPRAFIPNTSLPGIAVMVLAGPAGERLAATAQHLGLRVWREAFPERGYAQGGLLAARSLPGSSIHDPQEAARRAVQMALGEVVAQGGRVIPMQADTLCIHGDNPQAVEIASAIRSALTGAGIAVQPPSQTPK
jgi:5-oxoprolinase (ATP-hydrolysing) subunit A